MDGGAAHITPIEDPVDCSFLDKYADWRKYLREPTERERWRDERIRRLLKPFLEPHAPLDFLPDSPDASGAKERTEAEDILERALNRAEDYMCNFSDPVRWLFKESDDQDFNPFEFDPVDDQASTADSEIVFQRLIRKAREHQMKGEAYLAVVMYSRALFTVGANPHRSIIFEVLDATQSAGLLNSAILGFETFLYEFQSAEWPDEEEDDLTQQFTVRPRTNFLGAQTVSEWADESWEEKRVTILELLRRIVARLHNMTFARPIKFYWMLYIACTSQYFLLFSLKSPFGTDAPADDRGHEFVTRILFYLWDVVDSEIEGTNDDAAALAFLRFRIAKSLLEIQPYLDSDLQKQLGMPVNFRETDALYGLGLSAETLHSTLALISPLRSILIAFHESTVVLTCGLCREIAACLDNLVQLKAPLSIWGLLLASRLVGLGTGMGLGKRQHYLFAKQTYWEEFEAFSFYPLFRYNIAAYHNSVTTSKASSVLSPPTPLARLAFPFNVPRPAEQEQEHMAIAGLKAEFLQRWRITSWYPPAYLGRIFAPYLSSFGWEQYETRMTYVATCVEQHSKFIIDHADPWRLIGRAIGLGRLSLSKDYTTRIGELQMQIDTLGQLTDDVERLVSGHKDTDAGQGAIRAQLQLLLGEAYLELSELSWPPDMFVRRALGFFEECKRLATQFGHQEVTAASLRRLIDVQAELWRSGRAGVRPEDMQAICLEAEILLRPRLDFSIETSASSLGGRNRSWRAAVAQHLLPRPRNSGVRASLVGHIFAVASEVSLSQGKPLDALCWIQRGKANVTSGLIIQQRSLARFMSYVTGDRQRRPRSRGEIAKMWWQFVHSEEARSYVASAQQHPTIAKSQNDLKRELKQLRDTFETRSSLITGPREEGKGRVVFVDWSLASETDAYCLCIAAIPGTPEFLSVSIKPSEVRRWREEHWARPDKSLKIPEPGSPLRLLDELISPLSSYLQSSDTVIFCLTGDLHCLPIHALHLRNGLPLIYFHPVVHVPNIAVYLHCLQQCQRSRQTLHGAVPAMAAVYPPLNAGVSSRRHKKTQQELHNAVQAIVASLGADLFWDDAVTRDTLLHELQTRGVLCFIGHCISDTNTDLGLQQRLLLSNHEVFSTTDFLDIDMSPSLLVLLGCGTADHRVPIGDEMMNLIFAALASGATSVLGTLWPIRVETAVMFARSLSGSLKAKEHVVDGQLIDVARAMQRAILGLRESHSKPVDWAGYVLHGSPVMRDIFPRAGEGAVEATEGN